MSIYILRGDQQEGPYEEAQIRSALEMGAVTTDTMAWVEGTPDWKPLGALLGDATPPRQPGQPEPVEPRLSLPSIALDALQYPVCKEGWVIILVGAVCLAFAGMFTAGLGGIFVSGYLFAYFLSIISTSIAGDSACPDWPGFSSFTDDILTPYLQGMGATVISLGPAILLGVLGAWKDSVPLLICAGVCTFASIFYYPIAIIGVVVFGNIGGALPQNVIPALKRTMPSSLALGVMNLLLLGAPLGTSAVGPNIPVIGRIIGSAFSIYWLMAEARVLGLYYRSSRQAFRWE